MQVNFKVSPKLVISVDASDQKDLFAQLSSLQEVFGENRCGKCNSENLKYLIRTDKDKHKYYELICLNCRAKLSFGQHQDQPTLFPKRKDGDKWLPDRGWVKWDPDKKEMV